MKKIVLTITAVIAIITIATLVHIRSFSDAHATVLADCIVVFGAAVWADNTPSHALSDRMAAGINLYHARLSDTCLILSGGASTSGTRHEVDVMHEIALTAGVPEDALTRDYGGINTRATVRNLDTDKSYILVSNDFHLARIMLFAHRAHLHAAPHAAAYVTNGHYIKESYFTFREMIALWFYGLKLDIFAQ